jgi:hypothetical protein
MSRRGLAWLLLLAWCGCGTGTPTVAPVGPAPVGVADPPPRAGRPLIVIAMPDSPPFRVVRQSMVEELQGDFNIATVLVPRGTTVAAFGAAIEQRHPRAVVVMDNPVLSLYHRFAQRNPAPPVIAVMTSFLEELPNLSNTTGITYEVPGVTAFVQLRSVIARPVRRVAVLHRPKFRDFIERQVRLAKKEQVTLVPIEVSAEPTVPEILAALREAREKSQADALWILNDNGLLRDASFREAAWRPELNRFDIPVVVGLSSLVAAEARFGTFAVVPDHEALGVQSAQLVFKLADSDWHLDRQTIEPPISTVTIANLRRLKALFGLREGAAERVDRVVE